MKIIRIASLKGYKSFNDFTWGKYCKRQNKDGSCVEPQMSKFSVFFGENGSGKSSLCDILKSLSDNKQFLATHPQLAEITAENNSSEDTYTYKSGSWDSKIPNSSIIFFDIDFINANVHTNGLRSSNLNSGAHTQKSGKLIIDLDQQANLLNTEVAKAKENLDIFDKSNVLVMQQRYREDELKLYEEYKILPKENFVETVSNLEKSLKKAEEEYGTLNKLTTKSDDIQKIVTPDNIKFEYTLSGLDIYKEITTRVIEKKVKVEVDEIIKDHFEKHKSFIEYAKTQIPSDYSKTNCPLCMQPLNNASTVIEYYRSVFDKSFDENKARFLRDINALALELTNIESFISGLERIITQYFDTYEQIKDNFDLIDFYRVEEKTSVLNLASKLSIAPVQAMKQGLEGLKLIEKIPFDPSNTYKEISDLLTQTDEVVSEFNRLVIVKNKIVSDLKTKYTDVARLKIDLESSKKLVDDLKSRITFLSQYRVDQITKWKEVVKHHDDLVTVKKSAEKIRDKYVASSVPENIIKKMIVVLNKFNLNFTVEPFKGSSSTKDYAFSFKVKDLHDNERELKDGLSEGERQLISLSFFFAINDNIQDKKSKVLVFDDPITSLDAPNLKILAELIHDQISEFNQIIVFTHHPLFHKYLTKPDINEKTKFGVLKNSDLFGGSFVFSDPGYDMTEEVKLCNQEIALKATTGSLKMEEISLKYGQLLRLAIEKFIKYELLMWNREGDFGSQIVGNLRSSKSKISKLDEADLDVLTNIYNYCNQSNLLHVDKENPSALSELINNIDRFENIMDKAKLVS